jgi:hypothetical protein
MSAGVVWHVPGRDHHAHDARGGVPTGGSPEALVWCGSHLNHWQGVVDERRQRHSWWNPARNMSRCKSWCSASSMGLHRSSALKEEEWRWSSHQKRERMG